MARHACSRGEAAARFEMSDDLLDEEGARDIRSGVLVARIVNIIEEKSD